MTRALSWHLAVVALLGLSSCRDRHDPEETRWYTPAPAPGISGLNVVRGTQFELAQERGKIVLLSFGYTSCLEVCPDTFAKARRALKRLGDGARGVDFVYVTVDPERDQPRPFADFISSIDPRFIGVYAQGAALAHILDEYHVTVRKRLPDPAQYAARQLDPARFYAMDHTSGFWLIDRQGRLRVRFGHEVSDAELGRGLAELERGSA